MTPTKRIIVAIIAGCAGLYSVAAFAQEVTMGMIKDAANRGGDKSMAGLEMVFGNLVHNPLQGGGGVGDGMLGSVFMTLNACIFAVAVIWAAYLFVSSLIDRQLRVALDALFLGLPLHFDRHFTLRIARLHNRVGNLGADI